LFNLLPINTLQALIHPFGISSRVKPTYGWQLTRGGEWHSRQARR